ncbi:hypothetical protein CONLIGDRAFT_143446 [Coniochaeta ligniaria NRRL 30616]|uniref:Uncharacterized protein n=1 Tax=Coniochaeta ligniaria NRRL 30616 TaxID=1408157 RepID=A0A1J7I6N0_9PEZI|nr:hypothetical protein CONLIGDRAFT_143446 [Coniochaeta ligniaria NRRL 30616]
MRNIPRHGQQPHARSSVTSSPQPSYSEYLPPPCNLSFRPSSALHHTFSSPSLVGQAVSRLPSPNSSRPRRFHFGYSCDSQESSYSHSLLTCPPPQYNGQDQLHIVILVHENDQSPRPRPDSDLRLPPTLQRHRAPRPRPQPRNDILLKAHPHPAPAWHPQRPLSGLGSLVTLATRERISTPSVSALKTRRMRILSSIPMLFRSSDSSVSPELKATHARCSSSKKVAASTATGLPKLNLISAQQDISPLT